MELSKGVKERISNEVIRTLVTRFDSFPEDASKNRNAPFHEAFLQAFSDKFNGKVSDTPFLISLSSWMQGLNTTLGQSFFENVAHHLCNGEKREYTSKKLGNLKISRKQKNAIGDIITDLSNTSCTPNLDNENHKIFINDDSDLVNSIDFSADVFFQDETSLTAIELKTVKPNSGEMRGEKQKILEGKAALYKEFPDKQVNFYIGFPFDPTVDPNSEPKTGYNKDRFCRSNINLDKYFSHDEIKIASELWDLLSEQENTMEKILEIINTIATTEFLENFQYLNNNAHRTSKKYKDLLTKWNLFSEIELIENYDKILEATRSNKQLLRTYYNKAFNNKGCYNFERYYELKKYI